MQYEFTYKIHSATGRVLHEIDLVAVIDPDPEDETNWVVGDFVVDGWTMEDMHLFDAFYFYIMDVHVDAVHNKWLIERPGEIEGAVEDARRG